MRKPRALSLRRETLAALTTGELSEVAGGSHLCFVTDDCTHATLYDPCPTNPLAVCLTIDSRCPEGTTRRNA